MSVGLPNPCTEPHQLLSGQYKLMHTFKLQSQKLAIYLQSYVNMTPMLTLPTAAVRVLLSIQSRFGRLSMKAFFILVIISSAYSCNKCVDYVDQTSM